MSWDEAFADRYDQWSAHMTADITFYVDLARQADGPLVELAIANGRDPGRDRTGLEVDALYGGFAREPFADDSQEYVFLARRPASE